MKRTVPNWVFLLALSSLLLVSCAKARKKIEIASILQKCSVDLASLSMDSLRLEPDVKAALQPQPGSFLPDPKVIGWMQDLASGTLERSLGTAWLHTELKLANNGKDTLWLFGGVADIRIGEVQTRVSLLPGKYKSIPGSMILPVSFPVTLDGKLIKASLADTVFFRGNLSASPDSVDDPIILTFDEHRVLPKNAMRQFISHAKEQALRSAIDKWSTGLLQ